MTTTVDIEVSQGYTTATAPAVYKWDSNVLLVLHGITDTHGMIVQYILPSGLTVSRLAAFSDGLLLSQLPDPLLMYDTDKDYTIDAYYTDGATQYHITVPVTYRDKPSDYIPSDNNPVLIREIIAQSQTLVETARTLLESAKTYEEKMELLNVTLSIGTVSTLAAGSTATATLDKTDGKYTLNIGIPKGDKGDAFTYADFTADQLSTMYSAVTNNIKIGKTTTLEAGEQATVTLDKSDGNYSLKFAIPKGDKGEKGNTGASITLTAGTTTTLAAGSQATTSMTQSGNDYTLNFGIPQGTKGDKGEKGDPFTYSDFTSSQLETMYTAVFNKLKSYVGDGDLTAYGTTSTTTS